MIVDTNEVISSLIKDSFRREILLNPKHRFYTPGFTLDEIDEHLDEIVGKTSLSKENVKQLLDKLLENISVVEMEEYMGKLKDAQEIIGGIDEDDVPFIALALSVQNDGIWSGDDHFLKQDRVKICSNPMSLVPYNNQITKS